MPSPGQQTVSLHRVHDKFTPLFETFYFVALLDRAVPARVTANGVVLPSINRGSDGASADALATSPVNAFYWNASLRTAFVKVFDPADQTDMNIVANW